MVKKVLLELGMLLMVVVLVSSVLGITGSIGNSRMVLQAKQGDSIEKYILVKNVNDVAVDVKLFPSGDLEKYIDIKDENFKLEPGTDKKAYFTIRVAKEGTTETKINVQFSPTNGKNGVGLSSTIIIVAEKGTWFDWMNPSDEEIPEDNQTTNNIVNKNTSNIGVTNDNGISVNNPTGNRVQETVKSNSNKFSPVFILFFATGIIFLILLVLLIIYSATYKPKKEVRMR